MSAIFRPVKAVAMSELEVQRSVQDTSSHDDSGGVTTQDAESAAALSVVGGASSDLKKAGKHITSRVGGEIIVTCTVSVNYVAYSGKV